MHGCWAVEYIFGIQIQVQLKTFNLYRSQPLSELKKLTLPNASPEKIEMGIKEWAVSLISVRKIIFLLWVTKISIRGNMTTKCLQDYDEFN